MSDNDNPQGPSNPFEPGYTPGDSAGERPTEQVPLPPLPPIPPVTPPQVTEPTAAAPPPPQGGQPQIPPPAGPPPQGGQPQIPPPAGPPPQGGQPYQQQPYGGGPIDPGTPIQTGGGEPPKKRKGGIGRAILLTLLGMLVLFGLGFGLGQLFRGDKASSETSAGPSPEPCVTVEVTTASEQPSAVNVDVLNTGAPAGTATKTGASLKSAGFNVGNVGNDTTSATAKGAIIRYGQGGESAANTLKAYLLGDVTLEKVERSGAGVTLLLQDGFGGVASDDEAKAALAKPSPSPSGAGCPTSPAAPAPDSGQASATGSASPSA